MRARRLRAAASAALTVVVLDAQGVIRWIDVHADFGTRTEPAEILKQVADLAG